MNFATRMLDRVFGYGEHSITVPVLDGPLLPNRRLDEAEQLQQIPEVDNLVEFQGGLLFSSGERLLRIRVTDSTPALELLDTFDSTITSVDVHDEALAIGLDRDGVHIEGGAHHGTHIDRVDDGSSRESEMLTCPTSVLWLDRDTIVVTNGASGKGVSSWRSDLMMLGNTGTIWRIDLRSRTARVLARNLRWPTGLALAPDGRHVYAGESWRHGVLSVPLQPEGEVRVALGNLPAYPARLAPARDGGYWISFYSIRNQLVEFVLREKRYRERMLKDVPEAYWVAPTLRSGISFLEPMQQNELRQMGIMKPWAPTRSYGLVAHCDSQMRPTRSYHSRADGRMHGTVSTCELADGLFVAAKGAGALLRLPIQA